MKSTPIPELAAEAAAERAAIQAEGMTADELAIVFSWGLDSFDAYPKQRTAQSFAEFAKYVCGQRAKEKGKLYFSAPFAEQDGKHHRGKDTAAPRRFLPLDLDYIPNGEALLDLLLELQPFRHFAYTTASHTAELPRLRVVLELSRLVDRDEGIRIGLAFQAQLLERTGVAELKFDQTVYRAEQPCFGPLTYSEIYPRDRRINGAVLDVDELLASAPQIEPTVTAASRAERIAHDDPKIAYLYEHGYVLEAPKLVGKLAIRCPNAAAHSHETGPTSTVVLLPHFNGVVHAKIHCLHDSCANVTQDDFWRLAGYVEPGKRGNGADGHEDPPRAANDADGPAFHHPGDSGADADPAIAPTDFYSILPQHRYLYVPTRDLWPAESVVGRLGAEIRKELDRTRAAVQMTWHPSEPLIIENRIVADGGWVKHRGVRIVNLYRAPNPREGDPGQAGIWREHLRYIYPDDAGHIEHWLAHRIQRPGEKINHALVLGGVQGIGKDTLLEPVKHAVGPWNWSEISPVQMLGRFNGWAKAVVVRVSEARDLGDVDRFAFYDHSKSYIAAPPDVIRVDEKNLREHPVFNVMGVIITTNHKTDGIYLPADDRRHFVAWSERTKEDFAPGYWPQIWDWYDRAGGLGHVGAFLRSLDLSSFDPKAPPPKTPAWYAVVAAGSAPEDAELRDVIEQAANPDVLTLETIVTAARDLSLHDLAAELGDRKSRRSLPHKLERAGYVPVRNPDAEDGLFKVKGRRQVVYGKRGLTAADQIRAARRVAQ